MLSLSEPPLLAAVCKLLHLLPSRDEGEGQILSILRFLSAMEGRYT